MREKHFCSLCRAKGTAKRLKCELESASSEHGRNMAAIQAKLSMALTDVDKWREQAGKYECEVDNLQRNL